MNKPPSLILVYLFALVAANLAVSYFGPASAPLVAFTLIGLDITARDVLHERWRRRGLFPKMLALVAAGSLISYALNAGEATGRVALASFVAFALAGTADALTYHALRNRPPATKVNASNVVAAALDSVLFIGLAFGTLPPLIVALQVTAKVLGGALWLAVLTRLVPGFPPKKSHGATR